MRLHKYPGDSCRNRRTGRIKRRNSLLELIGQGGSGDNNDDGLAVSGGGLNDGVDNIAAGEPGGGL